MYTENNVDLDLGRYTQTSEIFNIMDPMFMI